MPPLKGLSLHLKTQVGEAVGAFHLDDYGVAGLQVEDRGAKGGHVGDGSGVEGVDDVAGLEAGLGRDEVCGAAKHDYAGGNAQRADLIAELGSEIDGENAEVRDETFFGIGGVEELLHMVAMLDGRNVESFLLLAAQDFQLQHLIEAMKIQGRGKLRKRFDAAVVGSDDDVLNLEAGGGSGAVGLDVGEYDSPVLRELETIGHCGRDFLSHGADLHAMHMAVLAQALVDEFHDARGDGEAQSFTAAAAGENEGVDADD